jgi:hypothetical protein
MPSDSSSAATPDVRRTLISAIGMAIVAIPMLAACAPCPPAMTAYEPDVGQGASTQIGDIAVIVAAERPDVFVGSAVDDPLRGPATLYIKGSPDRCIDELVRAASVPIEVAYEQPFSFGELEARQQRVWEPLIAVTDQVAVGTDITRHGQMDVVVTRSDRLPDADAVLSLIPADLRDAVDVRVVAEDVQDD